MLDLLLPWRWKRRVHGFFDAKFNSIRDTLITALNDTRAQLEDRLQEHGAEHRAEISELGDAVINGMREIRAHVDVRLHEQTMHLEQLFAQQGFDFSEMGDGMIAALRDVRAELESRLADHRDSVINEINDIRAMILNADGATQTRFNTLENAVLPGLGEQVHQLAAVHLHAAARNNDRSTWRMHPGERYVPAQAEAFEAYLARAAEQFPRVFAMWQERLEATEAAFKETKVGNAANVSDVYSWAFRDFFETHASGRVLDVGCGVFGRPFYLLGYPAELISGLEPLPMRQVTDFELIRGLSEYLPWPDAAFSTVISATSLDHCLSLQRSIEEMARVLRPGGRMLLWINSVPGSPKFEPNSPGFSPSDQYHLFHFDKIWFEPLLEARFEFLDRLELTRQGYSHLFYSLAPKEGPAAGS
jgi:SAM-dependent methyltransferase